MTACAGPRAGTPHARAVGYSGSMTMARVTVKSLVVRGSAVALKPVITQAWRPRQTSSPTGLPVSAMARAAVRRAACDAVLADELVGTGTQDVQPGGPAAHARALALAAVGSAAAPRPGELLEPALGPGRPVPPGLDHVEHHLHARPDALDEVGLGHEVGPRAEIHRVGPARRWSAPGSSANRSATARKAPASRRTGRAVVITSTIRRIVQRGSRRARVAQPTARRGPLEPGFKAA